MCGIRSLDSNDNILTRLHLLRFLHTLEGISTLALSPTQALLRTQPTHLSILTFLHLLLTTCTSLFYMHDISQALPTFPLPVISPMVIVPRTSSTPHALTSSVFSASPPHQASTPLFPSPPTRSLTLSLALGHLTRPGQAKPRCKFTFSRAVPLRGSQWSNFQVRRNRQYSNDHGTFLEKGQGPSRPAPLCWLRFQERRQRHLRLNPQPALRPLPRVVSFPLLHCSL
jgi:hypothetical protein